MDQSVKRLKLETAGSRSPSRVESKAKAPVAVASGVGPKVYIGSVPVPVGSDDSNDARPAAFNYVEPITLNKSSKGYVIIGKLKAEEEGGDKWFSRLSAYYMLLDLPYCRRIGRSPYGLIVVRPEHFQEFQAKYVTVFAELDLLPLEGAMLDWAAHAPEEDVLGLTHGAIVAYISHSTQFDFGMDPRRCIFSRTIDGSRHKYEVILRGANAVSVLASQCSAMGISMSLGQPGVAARQDLMLVTLSPACATTELAREAIGQHLQLGHHKKRKVFFCPDDIVACMTSRFDDSGAMMNNCKLLINGASAHFMKQLLTTERPFIQ